MCSGGIGPATVMMRGAMLTSVRAAMLPCAMRIDVADERRSG
jgi:hypothetical protein